MFSSWDNTLLWLDRNISDKNISVKMDQLWDPGQEWIQIFDNLLKHPQEWDKTMQH